MKISSRSMIGSRKKMLNKTNVEMIHCYCGFITGLESGRNNNNN